MLRFYNYIAHKVTLILSWLLLPLNKYLINKYSKKTIEHHPIFIVGAPRTGSTILYQSVTNQSEVLYFDNLVCRFNRILFIGFWLSNIIFGNRAHNTFRSLHGDTSKEGTHAPSECGEFWYRWLPKDHHFIDFTDLDGIDCEQIKKEVTAVSNYFQRPIIFKNLNAGQRMRLLSKIFPEAKFVFIRRDIFYTAQSILLSKRRLGITDNQFWSIMPRNVKELEGMEWPEQIAQQVFFIEKQILLDSNLFPSENFFKVEYLELRQATINDLCEKLELQPRLQFMETEFNVSQKTTISNTDKQKLLQAINSLGH